MNKKVLCLVLALVMVLGTFGTVLAADVYSTQDQKIQWLVDNEIVIGKNVNADGSADLALNDYLTRAEVTKLIVYTLKLQNLADAIKGVMQPFPDVDINHWANGYVSVATTQRSDVANGKRIVIGYPDKKFYPNNNVTYAELATMLVRIVKKDLTDEMEKNSIWATSYMRWAEEEGILKGLTITDSNKPVPRKDAFEMIFNAIQKLGDYKGNIAKFGDQLGIVSSLRSGQIQLNQDPEKVYKITANTMVTDGTSWRSLSANLDSATVGSLVRLIANKDGEVTHILELGNSGRVYGRDQEAGKNPRWFSVADYTVAGDAKLVSPQVDAERTEITIKNVTAKFDSNTRFFVADVQNNALKEVEKLSDIFYYYINLNANKIAEKVYMGYDVVAGRNVAKVVVFGKVDKYLGTKDVRRITQFLSSGLRFEAEDTKGARTIYDINNSPIFPDRKLVDVMDVVDIRINSNWSSLRPAEYVLIDYSEADVFEVVNVKPGALTLRDKYQREAQFYMPSDVKVFLEGQLKEGARVQIRIAKADSKELEIVSVVDKALKGSLPEGSFVGTHSGYLVDVIKANGAKVPAGYPYVARFSDTKDGWANHDYYVNELDAKILNYLIEAKVPQALRHMTFNVRYELGNTGVAYDIQYSVDQAITAAKQAIAKYRFERTKENYDIALAIINKIQNNEAKRLELLNELETLKNESKPVAPAAKFVNGVGELTWTKDSVKFEKAQAEAELKKVKDLEAEYAKLSEEDKAKEEVSKANDNLAIKKSVLEARLAILEFEANQTKPNYDKAKGLVDAAKAQQAVLQEQLEAAKPGEVDWN